MNTGFNIGGQSYKFKTTAENVKYGSGTLKDALDNVRGVEMSDFGRQLYEANEDEFRRLLKLTREDFWDENQNRWVSNNGAFTTTAQKYNGEKSLRVTASSSLVSSTPIVFGGQPFTISFYAKITPVTGQVIFRAIGSQYSFGLMRSLQEGVTESLAAKSVVYASGTTSVTVSESSPYWTYGAESTWTLIKFTYNGSGSLQIYQGGELKKTVSKTVPREPRKIYLGSCAGYFDQFKIIDDGVTIAYLKFED